MPSPTVRLAHAIERRSLPPEPGMSCPLTMSAKRAASHTDPGHPCGVGDVGRLLPGAAATAMSGRTRPPFLAPAVGIVLLVLHAGAAAVVGSLATSRRDSREGGARSVQHGRPALYPTNSWAWPASSEAIRKPPRRGPSASTATAPIWCSPHRVVSANLGSTSPSRSRTRSRCRRRSGNSPGGHTQATLAAAGDESDAR